MFWDNRYRKRNTRKTWEPLYLRFSERRGRGIIQRLAIKEVYPHYHLDYFNRKGYNPRWIDRVSDDEPSDYEMNIFNFYSIVYAKMKILLKESFELDEGQLRIPLSDFDEVLRECLINCLAHADYVQAYPSIKIEVFDGWFHFLNPGKMLETLDEKKLVQKIGNGPATRYIIRETSDEKITQLQIALDNLKAKE